MATPEHSSSVLRRADGSVAVLIEAIRQHGASDVNGDPYGRPTEDGRRDDPPVTQEEATAFSVRVYSDDPAIPDVLLGPFETYDEASAAAAAAVTPGS